MTAAGEANSAACKKAESTLKALSQVQRDNINDTKRLSEVVEDLTNTKLRDLRRALGSGKAELAKLTGSEADLKRAEEIRKKMKQVGDEIRLIEGQYVKIEDGLKEINVQSDQWLDKAIKQQRDLVGSLQKTDAGYQQNLDTLKKLEAEEDRRKGKMSEADASAAALGAPDTTASDLRRARATLTEARDNTSVTDTQAIQKYNDLLAQVEERLEAVSGKAREAAISWKQMRQVLSEPGKASGEDIKRTMEVIAQKIQQLPAGSNAVAALRKQYAMLEQTLKGTRLSQTQLNNIITRSKSGKASLEELRQAYKQLEEELKQVNIRSKQFVETQKNMQRIKADIDKVTGAAKKHGGAWSTALKNLKAYVGLFQVFSMLQGVITSAIKKNFEYSSSLTDIRKVSGLTSEEIEKLSASLAQIETRTNLEGLAKLAYEGAKLGMGQYGSEGLAGFVRAADQINVAIGEEMGEKALPALAKLVETMGLIPKMGVEKSMLATGSAMFKLSATSTATSGNIVEFAKRLTGVSRTAGITADQLLALGSASDALFLAPEVSATAISKFIVSMQRNHKEIEADLGLQKGIISKMFEAGKSIEAMVMIFEKLREKGNMSQMGDIFKPLGSNGQRLVTTMVTMAKNVDLLKDHLYEAETAFEEATAVTNEYEMQQTSAVGILDRANNLWEKAFVSTEGVENVKQLAQIWYDMSNEMLNSPLFRGTLNRALALVLGSIKSLVYLLPVLVNFFVARGLIAGVKLFAQMGTIIKGAIVFIREYTAGLGAAKAAQVAFNNAVKANALGALIALVMTAVEVIMSFVDAEKRAKEEAEEAQRKANAWKSTLTDAAVEVGKLQDRLKHYKERLDDANMSQESKQKLIRRINSEYRQYLSNLGIEIKSVDDLRKHYNRLTTAISQATYYRFKQKALEEVGDNGRRGKEGAAKQLLKALKESPGFSSDSYDLIVDELESGMDVRTVYMRHVKEAINSGKHPLSNNASKGAKSRRIEMDRNWKVGGYTMTDYGQNGEYLGSIGYSDDKVWRALNQYRNRSNDFVNSLNEVNAMYKPWIGNYEPPVDDLGTLSDEETEAERKERVAREKRERIKKQRDDLKDAQSQANALIDNVSNFYDRQINVKLQEAIERGMDKTEQEMYVAPLKKGKNKMLEQVRLAIAGKANAWEAMKLELKKQMLEQADATGVNLSEELLESIVNSDVNALRKKIGTLAKALGIPMHSVLAEILKKATKNAKDNLTLEAQQQQERQKDILGLDFTNAVKSGAYESFNRSGYANLNDLENQDNAAGRAAFSKRKEAITDMYEQARREIEKVYAIDVSNVKGRLSLINLLFGADESGMGERIMKTLGDNAEEWQLYYDRLIKYDEEYTAAMKKNDQTRTKLNEYRWNKSDEYKRGQAAIKTQERANSESARRYAFGANADTVSPWGQSQATDPELELLKLKLDQAKVYYQYIEAHKGSDEDRIAAAQRISELNDSLMDAVAAKAKATAEAQMKWYRPIEQYGTALGEALTDESKSVKQATRDMIMSFIDLTGEYVKQKLTQFVMTKLYNTLMAKSEKELSSTKKQQAVEDANTAVASASVGTAAGIAEGSAKTVGKLGWWGIPLIAVIGAVLGGLMSMAKGALANAFGGNKAADTNSTNFKVTSGMLTYDSGNVQGLHPYVADTGEIFLAQEDNARHGGVNLLTTPTATTINGQPSLVAENGPEIVIGRETTRAMMLNSPQLLKALVNFDRNYSGRSVRRTFDGGNVAESADLSGASLPGDLIASNVAANDALLQAANALLKRLSEPIPAKIDMFGHGNLYDSMNKATKFMKGKS
ncbi:MAG: hypothetical protein JJO71_10545 [Escherichia coli]|nr:hypothetical protein [Escherichia coli]